MSRRVLGGIALIAGALVLGGCPKAVKNDLSTVSLDRPNRGAKTEIAVPAADATAVTVAAVESENFKVATAKELDGLTRIMVSHGTTLTSWGEVGRIDLMPIDDGSTALYAIVEHLDTFEGEPSVESKFLPDWKQAIAARHATLLAKRSAGAYQGRRVVGRIQGKSFSASSGGGAGLGFLAGGFIGAAIGGAAEARRGQRTPYVYELANDGGTVSVRSFVPAAEGACVGMADHDMEPTDLARIAARKKELTENREEDAPPPPPDIDIVVLVPLPDEACGA